MKKIKIGKIISGGIKHYAGVPLSESEKRQSQNFQALVNGGLTPAQQQELEAEKQRAAQTEAQLQQQQAAAQAEAIAQQQRDAEAERAMQEQQRLAQEAQERASDIERVRLEQEQLSQRELEAERAAKQEAEARHKEAVAKAETLRIRNETVQKELEAARLEIANAEEAGKLAALDSQLAAIQQQKQAIVLARKLAEAEAPLQSTVIDLTTTQSLQDQVPESPAVSGIEAKAQDNKDSEVAISAAATSGQLNLVESGSDHDLETAPALSESHEIAKQKTEEREAIEQVAKAERLEEIQKQQAIQDVETAELNDARKIIQDTYAESFGCHVILTLNDIKALAKLILAGEVTIDSANKYLITPDLGPVVVDEMCMELAKPLMTQINPDTSVGMIPKPIENILDIIEKHSIAIAKEIVSSKLTNDPEITVADSELNNPQSDTDHSSSLLGEETNTSSDAAAAGQVHHSDFHG